MTRPRPTPREEPFESCGSCCEGWTVHIPRNKYDQETYGIPRVVRCWCFKAHQAKLAQQARDRETE